MIEINFPGLVRKTTIFLLLLVLLVLFFYLLGNYQVFLDTTQSILLRIVRTASILLSASLVFAGVSNMARTGRGMGKKISMLVAALVVASLFLLLSVTVTFLLLWASPGGR